MLQCVCLFFRQVKCLLQLEDSTNLQASDLVTYHGLLQLTIPIFPTGVLSAKIFGEGIGLFDAKHSFNLSGTKRKTDRVKWREVEGQTLAELHSLSRRFYRKPNVVSRHPEVEEQKKLWKPAPKSKGNEEEPFPDYQPLKVRKKEGNHEHPRVQHEDSEDEFGSVDVQAGEPLDTAEKPEEDKPEEAKPEEAKPQEANDDDSSVEITNVIFKRPAARKLLNTPNLPPDARAILEEAMKDKPVTPKENAHSAVQEDESNGTPKAKLMKKPAAAKVATKAAPKAGQAKFMRGVDDADWRKRHADLVTKIPADCLPQTKRHGEHSYTLKSSSGARVEVLVRQSAFRVQASATTPLDPPQWLWNKYGTMQKTWKKLKVTIGYV